MATFWCDAVGVGCDPSSRNEREGIDSLGSFELEEGAADKDDKKGEDDCTCRSASGTKGRIFFVMSCPWSMMSNILQHRIFPSPP